MQTIYEFVNEPANLFLIYLLIFTIILGFEVISKVPTVLHTPLMSGANAISGVVIIGAIILIRQAEPDDYLTLSFGILGVALGMTNVVGGFAVTDRMLEMFKKKKKKS
jgi:NAD(P) transhydrogenase subunit alpha